MKKKIAILGVISAMFAGVLGGCNEQLDQSVNGVSSVETFYATDDDAELAIIAVYDYAWDSNSPAISATWRISYMAIFRANMIVENIEPTNELRERIIAEAKAMRAYFYIDLVMQFGDVPLVLGELAPEEFNQARTPKAEVYAQIEQDLNEAIAVLPTKSEYSAGDKFRASKGMAYALLGKAELYQGNHGEAAAAFDLVAGPAGDDYSLETNYADIFKRDFEFGSESILEGSFSSEVPNSWDYPWGTRHEDNIHIQLMGNRAGSTPEIGLIAGWGFNYPSQKLFNAFEDGDTRRAATAFSESEYLSYRSTDPNFDGTTWWDYNRVFRVKYGSFSEETNTDAVPELNYGTNWRLIRYADILLLNAEAKLLDGDAAGALTAINEVRERAGIPLLTSVTMQDIMDERFVELAFEGHRYFDLIRWGQAVADAALATEIAPTFPDGDPAHMGGFDYSKHQLFPIPASELAAASELKQNDGY